MDYRDCTGFPPLDPQEFQKARSSGDMEGFLKKHGMIPAEPSGMAKGEEPTIMEVEPAQPADRILASDWIANGYEGPMPSQPVKPDRDTRINEAGLKAGLSDLGLTVGLVAASTQAFVIDLFSGAAGLTVGLIGAAIWLRRTR